MTITTESMLEKSGWDWQSIGIKIWFIDNVKFSAKHSWVKFANSVMNWSLSF